MEEQRIHTLTIHYHNARLYQTKLRDALSRIVRSCEESGDVGACRAIAESALNGPKPPDPMAHSYDQGIHTGHPLPEYLHLPMKPTDEFLDPYEG